MGIDISNDTINFGREYIKGIDNVMLSVMNANDLEFDCEFDVVLCLQNGLSAIKNDPFDTTLQCLNVLKNGGKAYFSTYSEKFWTHRVAWFEEQANKGLLESSTTRILKKVLLPV